MSFKKHYPRLYQFFAGYFPDADLDGLTDEEVVVNYANDCNKSEASKIKFEQAKKELTSLINNIDNYWQEVSQESNRYFENPTDTLGWLNMIKHNFISDENENNKMKEER